jgi:hypothetical protein
MYFSTIPLILFGLLVAEGGALPRDVGDYYWNLTQWQAGLSHGNPASPTTSWYSKRHPSPEISPLKI